MGTMANHVGPGFQGLVIPLLPDGSFSFFDLSFENAGYIKDDDAKNWNADELLKNVREATAASNPERQKKGLAPVEVTGWIEAPRYQADKHQLVWSIGARAAGSASGPEESINYRTLVLGRDGYMAMTLVTDRAHIERLRPVASRLLEALEFDDGRRYADFNSSTDHVAEFGLAALIAGVAAKKLGLLALGAAFFIKFAKVIALAVAALVWGLRKRLGLGGKVQAAPTAAALESKPGGESGAGPAA
jgi:uncharacterized membrane-anchored protein